MAAEPRISVVQGSTATLEVYVSGYPTPNRSQITWYRPEGYKIRESDEGVTFQRDHRILILSNIQSHQAGVYVCVVTSMPRVEASTRILLDVYGELSLY